MLTEIEKQNILSELQNLQMIYYNSIDIDLKAGINYEMFEISFSENNFVIKNGKVSDESIYYKYELYWDKKFEVLLDNIKEIKLKLCEIYLNNK